jgi:chromosome segregation ATPase
MNSSALFRHLDRSLVSALCLAAVTAFSAENAAAPDDLARLKAELSNAEDKLEMVVRSYTLTTKENETLKTQAGAAATVRDAAVAEAAAATSRAQEAQTALEKAAQEVAALRTAMQVRETENARLREILRQTQDTNAALAAENARLKTEIGMHRPSPAGSYVPPARPGS